MKTSSKEKIEEVKIRFSSKESLDSMFRLSQALSLLLNENDLIDFYTGEKNKGGISPRSTDSNNENGIYARRNPK